MAEFQTSRDGMVDLTPAGVEKIQSYPNHSYSEDTKPYTSDKRDWSAVSFATLWVGILVSIPVYMLASGLISNGMNWWQAVFTIVLGHTIVIVPSVLLGHFGAKYGTNFPLLSKFTFGPKGNVFPTLVRGILGCFWFGIQCWIGGVAMNSILTTIIPAYGRFAFAPIVSFLIFLAINVLIGVRGSRFIKFIENYAAIGLIVLSLIVIAWAAKLAGGFGSVLAHPVAQGDGGSFWKAFWPALTAMIAFDSTIAMNMSDFTRHAKSQKSQVVGQFIGAPITTAFIVLVGIFGTVGSAIAFGEAIWDPATLASRFENPVIVVIFSLMIVMAVLTTNVAGNLIPPGIVLSSLWPKVFKYKVAILIVGIIAILLFPWKIIENPDNYYNFINTVATLLGPMTGIYMVLYCKRLKSDLNLVDLYRRDGGDYFYTQGWNVKGLVILVGVTLFVLLGKFIPAMSAVYDSSYLIGAILAAGLYLLFDKLLPQKA